MRKFVRENSLSLAFGLLFLGTLLGQSFAGWQQFNDAQLAEHLDPLTWAGYVTSSNFAVDVAENWQSEFLAVGTLAVLSIYLRQRGSSQSKPVGEPHHATGIEG